MVPVCLALVQPTVLIWSTQEVSGHISQDRSRLVSAFSDLQLDQHSDDVVVAAITETWLREGQDWQLNIPGYRCFRRDRGERFCGDLIEVVKIMNHFGRVNICSDRFKVVDERTEINLREFLKKQCCNLEYAV